MSGAVSEGSLLVLNSGSSSVKFSVFRKQGGVAALAWRGQIEALADKPRFSCADHAGNPAPAGARTWDRPLTHIAALKHILDWHDVSSGGMPLAAAGHRIVHGGGRFAAPLLLGPAERKALAGFIPLAPLHQPHNLAGVNAVAAALPDLPQIGCFDTAFHATIPAVASTLALPLELREKGLRRYGFHGLSYEHVAAQIPLLLPPTRRRRVVAAHLGNGASLCAIKNGVSVDTTMGFSTLEGLVMGTRPGSIDAGALIFLLREEAYDAAMLEELLYKRSGLHGLSGVSADMRTLEQSSDPAAKAAIDVFVYRLTQQIAAMAAALGGLDALIFTGGIGERSAHIRALVCSALAWLGITLDPAANARAGPRISAARSKTAALIVPADEEGVIARHMLRRLAG